MQPERERDWSEEDFERRQAAIIAAGAAQRNEALAVRFARTPKAQRDAFYESLRPVEWMRLQWDWRFWGRPKQLAALEQGRWDDALFLAGRFFGKTRTGAETVWDRIARRRARSICFVGPDWKDVRRVMVGGLPDSDSGFMDVVPPWFPRDSAEGVIFNQGKQEIYVPRLGATIYLNTGEKKEQRGGNFDLVWIDEPIKFRYLEDVLANLDFALRKRTGSAQRIITTTPKRQEWLRDLIMQPETMVIHGVSAENHLNVAASTMRRLERRYGGTRLGKQEMGAEILGDNENAIASMQSIEDARLGEEPSLEEVGVGVDPAVSTKRKSDDTGIVVCGRFGGKKGSAGARMAVLEDASGRYSPDGWAGRAVDLAIEWGARFIVAERNKIGDAGKALLMHALRAREKSKAIEIREAYSFKDKATRATTSVQPLYDRGHVHHVGRFPELESQLTQWDPMSGWSPNNLDAFVHVAVELMGLAITEDVRDPAQGFVGLSQINEQLRAPTTPAAGPASALIGALGKGEWGSGF